MKMESTKGIFAKVRETTMELVSMLKTEEGRSAFVVKAKTAARTAKDKTVALWKSGMKGKAILCAAALLIIWFCIPSCKSESKQADRLVAESGDRGTSLKLKKLRNSDALFYEGSFPQGTSGLEFEDQYNTDGRYKSVAPNVYVLPDTVSIHELCSSFDLNWKSVARKVLPTTMIQTARISASSFMWNADM